jgi:serine/threonine protein kinase
VAVHANLDELLLPSTGGLAPLPPPAVDLVRHMLDMDAGNRFSIAQVLNHPWLQQQQLQEEEERVSIEAAYNHG